MPAPAQTHTQTDPAQGQITFQTLIGPTGGDHATAGRRAVTIGRAAGSDICLLNDAVSRKHAAVARHGGDWFLTDQGSKSGTYLNGVRLQPLAPAMIKPGDLVKIGPWTFRIIGPDGAGASSSATLGHTLARTIDESSTTSVDRPFIDEAVLQSDKRLQLLVEFLQRLGAAQVDRPSDSGPEAETALARVALESILQGSGYARGAVLRRVAGQVENVEIVATARQSPADTGEFHFSRSLVARAAQGEVAILTRDAGAGGQSPGLHSIADLRIHSALCAPIHIGESIEGFLYLDARGSEKSVRADASGFCQAAARVYGLALSNMRRIELQARNSSIEVKLDEAHKVQAMMLPAPAGAVGGLRYAMQMRPGMFVAGDLFDVVDLGEGRAMISIGDVTGHGIAPAMLMALVQSQLHAQILRWRDPARAIEEVNRYACPRFVGGRNASLWCGVIDTAAGVLTYVDGGHGHWLIRTAAGKPWSNPGSDAAGLLVGLLPDFAYEAQTIRLEPGWQLALYSDGIVEQRSDADAMFGKERLLSVLSESAAASPEDLVAAAFNAVTGFANLAVDAPMADDATVAIVQTA